MEGTKITSITKHHLMSYLIGSVLHILIKLDDRYKIT